MESLEVPRFSFALRLPDEVYTYFQSNPSSTGEIFLNLSTSELLLDLPTTEGKKIFKSLLCEQDNLLFFSSTESKSATYRGQLKYSGILLKPLDLFKPETTPDLSVLSIGDPSEAGNKAGSFKLHKFHRVLTSSNSENAIKLEILKKYGGKKQRANEREVVEKIYQLYETQEIWKIKQLSDETLQPEAFIRSIMSKIGEKAKTASLRGYWRLK
jgi:hypothetical protein